MKTENKDDNIIKPIICDELESCFIDLDAISSLPFTGRLRHEKISLDDCIEIVKSKFNIEVDASHDFWIFAKVKVFKIQYSNVYIAIQQLEGNNLFQFTFFKSDANIERNIERLHSDYIDFGITFDVKSIESAKMIIQMFNG